MGSFVSDGLTLGYWCWGEGDPIVLVHGWGSSTKGNWIDTGWVDALLPCRQVIAFDCRGHGVSDKPLRRELYSYAVMAEDVIALMDHLGIATADFMGYSMGSFMGASLLGSDAERFSSMILGGIGNETSASIAVADQIAAALRAESAEAVGDPSGRAFRKFVERDPDNDLESLALSALQMWPEGFPLTLAGPGLNSVQCPVLIVNGANDRPYIESQSEIVAAIPGARLQVVPDSDHLSAVSHPKFKEYVTQFLASI